MNKIRVMQLAAIYTKMLLFILLCVTPFLSSCKKENKHWINEFDDSLFQTIVVDPNSIDKKESTKLSEIAERIEYIPLQTGDGFLIGEMEKLIVWNGNFYIWERLTDAILIFDSEGKFLHKIQKNGQGPDEYPRIRYFTMDMKNGNIYIYSDMAKAIYAYTAQGDFIKKIPSPLILDSFAVQGSYTYYYPGRLPNVEFYADTYPDQYRYVVMENDKFKLQQLEHAYDERFLRIANAYGDFSYYNDTILLVESLSQEIYAIDNDGHLSPRYRIIFSSNSYFPTYNELDVERFKLEKKQGNMTTLFGVLFETSKYLFFNYAADGLIGLAYVNKSDGLARPLGYFFIDDFNNYPQSGSINFADDNYLYMTDDPAILSQNQSRGFFSSYLDKIAAKLQESDNPVIVKIKMK